MNKKQRKQLYAIKKKKGMEQKKKGMEQSPSSLITLFFCALERLRVCVSVEGREIPEDIGNFIVIK